MAVSNYLHPGQKMTDPTDGQVAPIWSQLEPDPRSFDSLAWLDQFQQWSFSLDWLEFSWSQDWAHKLILMILLMFFRGNFQKNSYVKGCNNCVQYSRL